jgi:membrane dipeptidase
VNALHERALVIDTHTHAVGFVPQPFRSAYRFMNRTTMPPDEPFSVLRRAGVDVIVAKAVGDGVVTRFHRGDAWTAVQRQLDAAVDQIQAAGGRTVHTAAEVRAAQNAGPAVILGVEGADAVGDRVDRVDEWAARGVRVVTIVHLGDNQIGRTCMPWQRYVTPARLPVGRRVEEGLSPFGARIVERMNAVGIVIDLAHADPRTVFDVVERTTAPVVATHSGARARQDFARFLTDAEVRAIASTGGAVGLWPYNHRGRGVRDTADLIGHARHVADLVGAQHLCVGTDMNGVPGLMEGYRGETDLPLVTEALLADGFTEPDVEGILGLNFLRVLEACEPRTS